MRSICLYFKVHQPVRLKQFGFYEIGKSSNYYDDALNEKIIKSIAANCYLPANKIILNLINHYQGRFKVAFSISGSAIDQFKLYAPEVIESFRKLADTGCVEFLAETYSHSLAALKDKGEFCRQVVAHTTTIETLFGIRPSIFVNTELIYSEDMGATLAELGYIATLAEGPNHIVNLRNSNYIYHNINHSGLKVLLKNKQLSEDISIRFSDFKWSGWPLTAQKYVSRLNKIPENEKIANLFINYETFGEHQKFGTGIFKFLCSLPSAVFAKSDYEFLTPSEVIKVYEPDPLYCLLHPASGADHAQSPPAWIGNCYQQEAFEKLYGLSESVTLCEDPLILKDWQNLQTSDHFYYMNVKHFLEVNISDRFNPYRSPYEAYINYMNVLNDLSLRLFWITNENHFFHNRIKSNQNPK